MVLEDHSGQAVSQAVECMISLLDKYGHLLKICRSAPPRLNKHRKSLEIGRKYGSD
jgi:hypothetical protein